MPVVSIAAPHRSLSSNVSAGGGDMLYDDIEKSFSWRMVYNILLQISNPNPILIPSASMLSLLLIINANCNFFSFLMVKLSNLH